MNNNFVDLPLLIQACKEQNPKGQRKLYEHFYGYSMNIALRYSKSKDEALEILNDAFLKIFLKINQFDNSYPFKPWLRKIVVNTAIDYYRKNSLRIVDISLDNIPEESYFDPFDHLENENDMLPIIQELPPMYRMVFNLYVMEEYKHQEIADKLNITVSTSKSNLSRAKAKLRTAWLKNAKKNNVSKNLSHE